MHGQNLNSLLKQKGKVCQIADIKNPDNIVSKDNLRTLTLSFVLFWRKKQKQIMNSVKSIIILPLVIKIML